MAKRIDPEKASIIKLAYPLFSNAELSEYANCSINWIEKFAQFNGLKKARCRHAADDYGLPIDLLGMKFGDLQVLEKMPYKTKNNIVWLCRCQCARTIRLRSSVLVRKQRTNCGQCDGQPRARLRKDEAGSWWWSRIKSHARERGIEVNITLEYVLALYDDQNGRCAISGRPICFPESCRKLSSGTASLDRIDSAKAYEEDNVQWVHKEVNLAKNKLTDEAFISMCRDVTEYQATFSAVA